MPERAAQEAVINQVAAEIHTTALDKGFWEPPDVFLAEISTKLMLITSEVAEAQAVMRDTYDEGEVNPYTRMTEAQGHHFIEELADVIIRTFDTAQYFEGALPPIGEVIHSKMAKNSQRPVKHGKRF